MSSWRGQEQMRFFLPSEGGTKCDPSSTWLAEKALTAPTDRNWLQHTNRIPRNGSTRILKNYRQTDRRNQGRPLQGLLDA